MFTSPEIHELPLSSALFKERLERFLAANGLRYEALDKYFAVYGEGEELLAGAGIKGDVIKCVAVSEECRSEGFTVPVLSRLISDAAACGITVLKVFTKPGYETVFQSLGFRSLARAPKAVFMENGRGLEDYCAQLRSLRDSGKAGVIVMNANPFTLGHLHLVRTAASQVDRLFVIPVTDEGQLFPYAERLEMICSGCGALATVLPGSAYQISSATFPTYFLKDLSDASETQMRLDLDLFCRHIAPALGVSVRFAGSEPQDPLTARYNAIMGEMLPAAGIAFVEVPRLCNADGPVSASRVREALDAGLYGTAAALVPDSTLPYLLSALAERALRLELDAPLKPGLVCPDSSGSHKDMDYALMQRAIVAISPLFARMARTSSAEELRALGMEAESAMLAATGGVNTHRGAIFALGLAVYAAGAILGRKMQSPDSEVIMQNALGNLARTISDISLNDNNLHSTHGRQAVERHKVKGALQMACEGYGPLFADWLPYYRSLDGDEWRLQKTLLRIMSSLDDTCVIHRVGYERAMAVKREAAELVEEIPGQAGNDATVLAGWTGHLKELCARYAAEGISPGGAADMLALTIFIDSILN